MSIRNELQWMDQALCAKVKVDPDVFSPKNRKTIPDDIRALCARCPVRIQCDAHGRANRDSQTIRAGMPLSQRGIRPSALKYVCTHCGVRTRRKSEVCPACAPNNKHTLTGGR